MYDKMLHFQRIKLAYFIYGKQLKILVYENPYSHLISRLTLNSNITP